MQNSARYTQETVLLDGEAFDGCEFTDCRLVYAGGDAPSFTDCRFNDCEWKFEDAAARTLGYLKLIWSAGAKSAVQSTIKDITVAAR